MVYVDPVHAGIPSGPELHVETGPLRPPRDQVMAGAMGAWWDACGGATLNLGSGRDPRPGWTDMDLYAETVDVRHDITQTPWPFPDASFGRIFCDQVAEHLPPVVDGEDTLLRVLREAERVLAPGGLIYIGVPTPHTTVDYGNITHYRRFSLDSFHFLHDVCGATLAGTVPGLRLVARAKVHGLRRAWWNPLPWHARRYLGIKGPALGLEFMIQKQA